MSRISSCTEQNCRFVTSSSVLSSTRPSTIFLSTCNEVLAVNIGLLQHNYFKQKKNSRNRKLILSKKLQQRHSLITYEWWFSSPPVLLGPMIEKSGLIMLPKRRHINTFRCVSFAATHTKECYLHHDTASPEANKVSDMQARVFLVSKLAHCRIIGKLSEQCSCNRIGRNCKQSNDYLESFRIRIKLGHGSWVI